MFVEGRRKTELLRWTARVGVAVMLFGLYRPAYATAPAAKARDEKMSASPAGARQASAAGPPPMTATAPSTERVRAAIVPVGVKLESGAMGADPWALFDGDGTIAFRTGQPLRVRVSLPKGVTVEAIGVYGGNGAVMAVSADGAAKPIPGLEKVALDDLPARWNRFSASTPVETASLLLDIVPASGQQAEVPELELWGRAAPSDQPSTSRGWAEALLTHLPAGAVEAVASPSSATIAAPQLGPAGHVPFTVDIDRAARQFERAFLVYELEGLAHWSQVVRRVNWQAPQGGFHAARAARHGLQVEEISPDWLREGKNELQFIVSDRNDPVGYKVKNLRIVGVPATGNAVARAQIDTPRAEKIASALVDGSRDTGLTNKDLRRAQTIDFRFAEVSQPDSLMVAVDKGAKGTLAAQAIVKGAVDRASQVSAELDQLAAGWTRLPLDSLPAEADGIRVTLRGAGGESSGGLISELRVTGSRVPTRRASRMTVTYPLHGECVDGEAYVRGFLRGDAGSIKGAALRIGGATRPEAIKWDGSFSAVVPTPAAALRTGGKWQVELEASFANGDATGAVVDIEGCKEPVVATKKTGPIEDEGAPFGQVVRAGESAKLSFAGATLEIPAGALDDDTRITIRPISDIEIPATDESLTNVTAGGRAYRLGPHGLKFGKPVSLTIPFDRGRFVGGQAEDDMGAYFFDEEAKRWRQVQTLKGDASNQLLTAATEHFTDFIAGTISTPDHPAADSFNPNSIKDLKAADPAAGIELIKPPEASPDGAAHLSFPIWVPPGRLGMQPSLAVTYNSSAGNGLMGIGWSLPISSIGVDTRFGVGRYSQTEETETYEIDGELLVPDLCNGSPCAARNPRTAFHRRAEGKFDTFLRVAGNLAGPKEEPDTTGGDDAYHWEVLDKRGTLYIYGETFSQRGSRELRGVYRWYLSRVIDAFGNQITYSYEKRTPVLHQGTNLPTVEVLLKTIRYTADSNGHNPHYRIDFDYDGQSTGDVVLGGHRRDTFTNARGGTIEVTDVRLARIQVYQDPDTGIANIRRYDFRYNVGSFDKSLLVAIVVAQGGATDPDNSATNGEFYRHSFNYFKVVKSQTTGNVAFDAPVAWPGAPARAGLSDGESDSVNGSGSLGGGAGLCDLAHADIGGSTSVSIPLPLPPQIASKNNNNDFARRELVDVNGDGLPDFVGSGGVQLNGGDSSFSASPRAFSPDNRPFQPSGTVHIADHSSVGINANVHFVFEAGHVDAGVGRVWGSSGDNALLADIDGDGFIDYLKNDGNFALNSHGQGFSGTSPWGTLPPMDFMPASVVAEQKSRFSLTEPTALWTAPFSGHVNISSVVQKTASTHPNADGVKLFVDQYHTTATDTRQGHLVITASDNKFHAETKVTDSAVQFGPGGNNLLVLRGDRVYFRVNPIDDIDDDAVIWNPVITYSDTTNDVGGDPVHHLSFDELQLPEPFSGAAFSFVQASGSDMRLAGEPIPTWHNDSAGPDPAKVIITSTGPAPSAGGQKFATSDAVTLDVLLAPNGDISAAQSIAPSTFQKTYDADYAGPISVLNFTQAGLNPGDRIFFQVSSQTPIDPKQIDWKPVVEYIHYCRRATLPPDSTDFTHQTTVCGDVVNCASATGCELSGDPDAASNTIAATTIGQQIPAYFKLLPWIQTDIPTGFIPPGDGTVTLTGTYQSTVPARLVARGLQRLAGEATAQGDFQGTLQNAPTIQFSVTGGDAILFDAFTTSASAGTDTAHWRPHIHYEGPGGPVDTDRVARRNYLSSGDQGAGHVHGWQYLERNVDPNHATFDATQEVQFQQFLVLGLGNVNRNSPNPNVNAPAGMMRQAPDGLQPPPPGVTVAGPLWAGASVDGYIGEAVFKPSRTSRPITGSRVAFSSTNTTSTDVGAALLFGTAADFSTSSTGLMLIDMNGDHYPDLVTPDGIQFNHPRFTNPNDPTIATGGQFDSQSPIKNSNGAATPLGKGVVTSDGDLQNVDGRQVSASLGISGPVSAAMSLGGKKVPGWVSVLPSIGVSYGHSQTVAQLLDINGDGLPDYVRRDEAGNLIVRLNLGFLADDPGHAFEFTGDISYGAANWSQTGAGITTPSSFTNPGNFLAVVPLGDFTGAITSSLASTTENVLNHFHGMRSDALRVQNSAGSNIGAGYSYLGGGLTFGLSRTTTDMVDINGDGLPDMVKRDPGSSVMSVALNQGDTFAPEQFWDVPSWPNPPDGPLKQFVSAGFGAVDTLAFTENHGQSESVGFSKYFELEPFGCWGFEVGVGAGQSFTGSEMRFEDIDGDGAPDQVLKYDGDANLYVRRNPAGGTIFTGGGAASPPNLLQLVTNPLGGGFTLAYARLGNVVDPNAINPLDSTKVLPVDMPHRENVLVDTQVFSSLGGPIQDAAIHTLIDYSVTPSADGFRPTSEPSGFYSRTEREFFGFSHITTTRDGDGLQIQRFYDNTSYAKRHLLLAEQIRDTKLQGGPKLFRTTVNTYDPRTIIAGPQPSIFQALTVEKTSFFEAKTNDPNAAPAKSTTIKHDYDATGNPILMEDFGDDDTGSDDIHYAITYQQTFTNPLMGVTFPRPKDVFACNVKPTSATPPCQPANTLRHRSASYGPHGETLGLTDDLFGGKDPATGNVYVINQSPNPTWAFTYDEFGNLATSTDPNGYKLTYTYEGTANAYIKTITDSFNYTSSRVYDLRFGTPLDTTDVNGYRQHFDSDIFGRQTAVIAPEDIGSIVPGDFQQHPANATVAFSYAIPGATPPAGSTPPVFSALTQHKDFAHSGDTIDTVVLVDGLGRVRETKKDATVGSDGRIVSGQVTFDQVGRVYQEGFPFFETASNSAETAFVQFPAQAFAKTNSYDVLGRVRAIQTPDNKGSTVAPDGSKTVTTLIDYSPKTLDNLTRLAKTVQDPQGKLRTQYLSPRGEIVAVSEQNRLGTSSTLTTLTTRYTYDPLSQLTQVDDPSHNFTTAKYDSIGHMVFLNSPDAGQTEWRYDGPGKLAAKETAVLRGKSLLVKYTYDVNRLQTIVYPPATGPGSFQGATGLVTYTYGKATEAGSPNGNIAGRIAKVTDESGTETRQYDTLGNVSHMEKTPQTMSSSIPGVTYKMDYAYDVLGRVKTMTYPDQEVLTYGYDAGGLVNSVKGQRKNGTQATYVSNLTYNQLGQREGLTLGNGWFSHYFYYTDTKRLQGVMTTRGTAKISDSQYLYDLVGNITSFTNGLTTPAPVAPNTVIAPGPVTQNFVYDDLYQLTSASGGYTGCACGCGNSRGYTLTMQYDGLGNITRKNQTDTIFQPSGATTPQVATTYNNGYTYGATQSSGQKAGPHAPTGVGAETISYDFDGNQTQYSGSFGPTRSLTWTEDDRLRTETDSGFTNTFLYDADGTRTHKRRTTLETWYVNPFYVVKNSLTESKHIMLGNEKIVTAVATITNRADPTTAGTNTLFFYHPDHLQSTSYMTGGDGSILQHDEYFPSGEVWFQEQKNNDARNTQPYLFNAKELDETGLYYFGARYYNPKLSVWISTDPILAGYVRGEVNGGVFSPRNLGLYTYSFNNPVVLRDPDGLAPTAEQVRKFREGTLDVNKEMASGRMTVNEAIDLYRAGGFTDVRSYENGDTSRFIPALAELMVKAYLVGKSAMEAFGGLLEHLGEAGATGAGAGSPPVVSPGPSGGELPPAGSPPSPGGASPEFHSVYGDGTLVPEGQQPPRIPPGADPGSGQLNTPAEGAHTRLRLDPNQGNRVYQGREIDAAGHPVRDVDFTNPTYKSGHPRPGHPGPPHQHQWTPVDPANPKAGYRREKLPEPM